MKLEFNLTEQDYIDFNLYHFDHSKSIQHAHNKSRFGAAIAYLALPFVLVNVTEIPFAWWMTTFSIVAIVWILLFPSSMKKFYTKQIKKVLQEKNNSFFGKKILELRDDGVMTKGDSDETMTSYHSISQIAESNGNLYLYNSSVSAIIVPASAFSSSDERKAFIETLRPRIQEQPTPEKQNLFSTMDKM